MSPLHPLFLWLFPLHQRGRWGRLGAVGVLGALVCLAGCGRRADLDSPCGERATFPAVYPPGP